MRSGTGRDTSATEPDAGRRHAAPTRKTRTPGRNLRALPAIVRFLWRGTRGYRLRPWASPYLRWRIETYWGWHAEQIDARSFWAFSWGQRRPLWRFLLWASDMASQQNNRLHS
jgi:hypothetical protein